jgi:uncharacterized repeat protein (TIGR01451 family)
MQATNPCGSSNWQAEGTWTVPSAVLSIAVMHTGNFTQGQAGAVYAVTVANQSGASATSGVVTVTEILPSGMTLVAMTGTGWTCATTTCTRSDPLAAGASYPAITVTVNVAVNATSPLVNQVGVSGGGSAPANASDPTIISAATSNLAVGKPATQSSTYPVYPASLAVDGNTDGAVPHGSVAITSGAEATPWW